MINALEIPADIDLSVFSQFLQQRGVRHRISEEGLDQVVWTATETEADFIRAAYLRLQAGELHLDPLEEIPQFRPARSFKEAITHFPITLLVIFINMVCFPIGMNYEIAGDDQLSELFRQMMFLTIFEVNGQFYFASLMETLANGEYWRMFTPMLIHFSWLHVVFNLLWVWEIGRRIEAEHGGPPLILIVLFTSLISNLTQFFLSGPGLFGGMSGVVFGLLGHSLVWSRMLPLRSMRVPNGIYIFMFIYLAVGFTGAIDLLGLGDLANGAHLGGLIGGVLTGAIAAQLTRFRSRSDHQS